MPIVTHAARTRVTSPSLLVLALLVVALLPGSLAAQGRFESLRDPDDGALDLSSWLATTGGFLPVVSPVTEPAVGYGGAVALAFFHRPPGWTIDEARRRFEARERMEFPSISAGFGMYTASKSWLAGVAHLGVWDEGRWRYTGGAGRARLNLEQAVDLPLIGERAVPYELDGWGLVQDLRYRIGETDLFFGLTYSLLQLDVSIPLGNLPGVDPLQSDTGVGILGLNAMWDSRNNPFTTDDGIKAEVEARRADSSFGGDFDYWAGTARIRLWVDPIRSLVAAVRVEGEVVSDGAPFWLKPGVSLRGVPAGRYTGDRTVSTEAEVRWDFAGRWSLVGFGGAGFNYTSNAVGDDRARSLGAGGAGVRYLLARAFGLRSGVDFAWGRDGFAFYIVTGSAL